MSQVAAPRDQQATPLERPRWAVVSVLGACQILAWGSSYYLPAVLAGPIGRATGWPAQWIVGGLSVGLFVSGLAGPAVGRSIDRLGGRPVLAASAVLLAAGLAGLGLSPNLPCYVLAWVVVGLGMGCGLYDPAFSMLGRAYGEEARPMITGVTLWGGFASTVCWPLSAFLADHLGWRGACLTYAAIHLGIVLPLYLFGLPREPARIAATSGRAASSEAAPPSRSRAAFWLVATALTLAAVVMTFVSVQLLAILQGRGLSLASAVALGALMGPSQVGARVLEFAFGRRSHPIWAMLAATVLVLAGLAMLLLDPALAAIGVVLYGAGGGIRSIARGTLPLALFGRDGYATLMGRIAMPSQVAQALSPTLGAIVLQHVGATGSILVLIGLAGLSLIPVLMLIPFARRGHVTAASLAS